MPPRKSARVTRDKATRAQATKIPDNIYKDLASDVASTTDGAQGERPLKRRRLGGDARNYAKQDADSLNSANIPIRPLDLAALEPQEDQAFLDRLGGNVSATESEGEEGEDTSKAEQVVYDDSESSEDGEVDWANILSKDDDEATDKQETTKDDLHLDLEKPTDTPAKRAAAQRLSTSVIEKRKRLDIHKIHMCTLLAHVHTRNAWCNDYRVQDILSRFLDKRARSFLNPKPSLSQRDRTTQFIKGLDEASHVWRGKFVISARGMRKPEWPVDQRQLESLMKQAEDTEFEQGDFLRASAKPSGSRDVGAQLFCALLRSVGVDARLVCSLQALSFTAVAPTLVPTPTTTSKTTIDLSSSALDYDTDASAASATSARSTSPTPRPIRRFGRQARGTSPRRDLGKAPAMPKIARGRDSSYPVFWVEAFNTAKQQWVAVDPFATRTVNRPAKLEPPASDSLNDMIYVVAFNEDGTAKDVTRRYVKAYNAKTRRNRVEATQGGERWLKHAMKIFKSPMGRTDRDVIEDGELDGYEAKEPIPRNVQDFKGHPYYALERHLKRHEALHPRREVGKLRTGNGENVEPVFRRRDVNLCQTGDKWYRNGRELKAGEQPLKRVPARRKPRNRELDEDEQEDEGDGTVGLYAHFQTELYKPPACEYGKVPKNPFKNLDVYVPSMIPPGGVHIRSSDGVAAAKILKIDWAEAVAGFHFRGRKGTAIVKGVVVAKEYREAMEEVVEYLRWQRAEADRMKRTKMVLVMWKRFLVGMRIRERVMGGQNKMFDETNDTAGSEDDQATGSEFAPEDTEGGFVADDGPIARPTRGTDRDIVKEKFQDGLAETINEEPEKKTREHWEPTVASPWDIAGLLEPIVPPLDMHASVDALFEDAPDEGGFMREDGQDQKPDNLAPDHLAEGGGFVQDEPVDDDSSVMHKTADEGGGGFLPAEEEDSNTPQDPKHNPTAAFVNDQPHDPISNIEHEAEQETDTIRINQGDKSAGDDSDSLDNQSLLSHDPNDDDAEPDWLDDEVEL